MTAYKIGGDAGDARCQHQIGLMYCEGRGVDVDYELAMVWLEKAAAQNDPYAVCEIGSMYYQGEGVAPSWRRTREYYQMAVELGSAQGAKNMQKLSRSIAAVTNGPLISHLHHKPPPPL